ncbi:MFS-type transporter SLC18B1 [Ixodes scapularis]|uniref:MFS-type transporter SLC18B1 n=1 Tax=Ixodes scapularis TaxID=6945 RepID=UPI0011616DD3|nr:MFS-type transporter SLC18B1 [Ixodes scapularis]
MRTAEAMFWSSYSAVASPSIQEEIFVQKSAPSTVWFTKTASVDEGATKITRRQWLIAGLIYAGNFCAAMSFSLQAPFFPKKAEEKGATPTEYGLIFSAFYFTIFLIAPVYGKLIALVTPKTMLNGGFILSSVCVICFGFIDLVPAGRTFVALAFVIRITEGFGAAAYITASSTIIMSEFPKNIGLVLSSLKTSFSVGMIVGPTVGGFLYDLGGYTTPFVVCGGLGLSSTLVTLFIIPKTVDKMSSGPTNLRHFWSGPMVYLYGLAIFGSYACAGFNTATMEPHLRQFHLSTTILGLVFMIPGLFNCAVVPVWGKLCDWKVNTKLLTSIGALFVLLYLLLVGPAPFMPFDTKLWLVILSMAFFGVGIGGASICAFMATLQYTLSRGFQPSIATNGLISSMFTLSQSIGSFTGPALGGMLLQHVGYKWGTMVLFSFEAVVASVLIGFYIRDTLCPEHGQMAPRILEPDSDVGSSTSSKESMRCDSRTISYEVEQKQQYGSCCSDGPTPYRDRVASIDTRPVQ